ncbi:MAG: CvpA family protein [Bacillota bacterium]
MPHTVDAVTVCVVVVLALGFAAGVKRGLAVVALDAAATIVALAVACSQYNLVGRLIGFIANIDAFASAVSGFVVAFFAMSVVTHVVATLFAKLLRKRVISVAERVTGGIANAACTCVVVSVLLSIVLCVAVDPLTQHVAKSEVSMALAQSVPALLRVVGLDLPEFLDWDAIKTTAFSSHTWPLLIRV